MLKEGGHIRCSIIRNNRTLQTSIISYDNITSKMNRNRDFLYLGETVNIDFAFSFDHKSGDLVFRSASFDLETYDFEEKASVLGQKATIAALEGCVKELGPASGKIGIASKKHLNRLRDAHVHIVDIKKRIDRKRKRIEALEKELKEVMEFQDSRKLTDTERFEACELNNKIDDQNRSEERR